MHAQRAALGHGAQARQIAGREAARASARSAGTPASHAA
jgi:hypothetical protein